jgi:hypothetical protein
MRNIRWPVLAGIQEIERERERFVEMSHGMQKCQECHFLENKEGQLEWVFAFCQLHLDASTKC